MEIWKPLERIPGYEVSNLGRVKSTKRDKPKLLKSVENNVGYELVCLSHNNVKYTSYIHRLVAEVFIPTGMDKNIAEVNHKDKNRKNNCVDNLEWTSYSDNQKHKIDPERYEIFKELNCLFEKMNNKKLKKTLELIKSLG